MMLSRSSGLMCSAANERNHSHSSLSTLSERFLSRMKKMCS